MTYRILTLDGGGAWAILEAMALLEIYGDLPGRDILNKFDLVGANSGGAIVLGALISNRKPSDIISLFLSDADRAKIFVKLPWWKRVLSTIIGIGARYSTEGKRAGIASYLGTVAETPMKDLTPILGGTRVFIAGFDYDWLRAEFYRTYTNRAGSTASMLKLADAINASSTAPVNYFDAPAKADDGRRRWDGGLGGYNNPVLAAVVEATIEGKTSAEIAALSIGSGTVRLLRHNHVGSAPADYVEKWDEEPTLKRDIMKVATAILDDPPDAATFIAYMMLGNDPKPPPASGGGNIVRMNAMVQPDFDVATNSWGVPPGVTESDFKALLTIDSDAASPGDVPKVQALGRAWIAGTVTNQGVYMGIDKLDVVIGDATFAAAKARWLAFPP